LFDEGSLKIDSQSGGVLDEFIFHCHHQCQIHPLGTLLAFLC
jgi:hypothetical protein